MGQEPIHHHLGQLRLVVGGVHVSSPLMDALLGLLGRQTIAAVVLQIVVSVASKQRGAGGKHAGHVLARGLSAVRAVGGAAGLGQAFLELFFAVGFGDPTSHVARIVQVAAAVKEGIIANRISHALGDAAAVGVGSDAGFGSGVPGIFVWVAIAGRRTGPVFLLFGGSSQAVEQFSQSL